MQHNNQLGTYIRIARESAGWDHIEAARRTSFQKSNWSHWEHGRKIPSEFAARILDSKLGCDGELISLATAARARATRPKLRYVDQRPRARAHLPGREHDLTALDEAMTGPSANGVTVLDGPAGCGKTELALHWARRHHDRWPHGTIVCDLRGHCPRRAPAEPDEVLGDILADLGVPLVDLPGPEDRHRRIEARSRLLLTLLADREILLILDDAASTEQVLPLLPGAEGSAVLITSRHRLSLPLHIDARPHSLHPLAPEEGVTVLETALAHHPQPRQADTLRRITARCDGLPLALVAVAHHATNHPWQALDELADLLDTTERLALLDAAADGDPRASLITALDTSYRHITQPAATVLNRLAHTGGEHFTPDDAAQLADNPSRATAILGELAREHLITHGREIHLPSLISEYARSQSEPEQPAAPL